MSLIQLSNIKKNYGPNEVLRGVECSIFNHSRIGLVGVNGSGKTTLVRIILGEVEEDEGEVIRQRGLKIAYLPQIPLLNEDNTVLEEALETNRDLHDLGELLEAVEQKLSSASESETDALIREQARLSELYERQGGYRHRADTEAMLEKLGFTRADLSLPVRALSGGQKNRLGLGCTLLKGNELLLLDEPTNFLDLECTEWLEGHLKNLPCAMLIISHDRYFLNQVAKEVWDLSAGKLRCYTGNYDAYCAAKEQEEERRQELYERQQAEIKRQEDFISRNIYGQKHSMAQSRRKMLERMERLDPVHRNTRAPQFAIRGGSTKSGRVLEARDLGHAFGDNLLFDDLSFALESQEKMAVVGPNGCGKSTLLHILIGRLQPQSGYAVLSSVVDIGFYHQELKDLPGELTAFDTIKNLSPTTDDKPVRDFLGSFLFRGDDVFKHARDMSGGEKSRLAMAKLLYSQPSFLILDEPTNHLDILSRQAMERALQNYQGTLLFVSHDRYFIDRVATCLLVFHRKKWVLFYGNYSQFHSSRQYLLDQSATGGRARRTAHQNMAQVRDKNPKKRKKYTLEELEEKIITAETRLSEITRELGTQTVYQDPARVKEIRQEYDALNCRLAQWNEEWENWEI